MDSRSEISSFLTSRRGKLSPEEAGVPLYGGARRVPGLRREEVAHLAGVSADYYARLERGKLAGASREVLDSIDTPALVQNARLDRLAFNRIGRALHSLPGDGSRDQYNYAKWLFLDSRAPRFHRDLDTAKHDVVALLRAASAQDPYDRELIEIVGTLTTQSEEFSALWASHDVLRHRSGAKLLTHPDVGDLEFGYESFELSADPGLVLLVFTIEPNSPTAEAMQLLASWAASTSYAEDEAAEIEAEQERRT